jgi:GntR family transcriptional repressor for pyruvate dehydrogenase complex
MAEVHTLPPPERQLAERFDTRRLGVKRERFLDLQRIRGKLDVLAVEGAVVNATAEDLDCLARLAERFEKAAKRNAGIAELAAIDVAFHLAIARASGSPLLKELLGSLHPRLNDARVLSLTPSDRPLASAREHHAILRAIEARSSNDARAAAEAHTAAATASLERSRDNP